MKIHGRSWLVALPLSLTLATVAWANPEVAKVNGRSITRNDMLNALRGYNEGQRASLLKDMNTKRQIVQSLIDQEVLVQQAEKEKIDNEQDYKDAIAAFRKQFLASRVIQKNLGNKVNDAAAKKFYEKNKKQFSTDEAKVQHILVADESRARDLLKQAKAGEDFQALAEKNSIDPSAKNNRGDLGIVTRDSPFVPEFKNAVFDNKSGEIVGPVKTEYGYHVIRIVEKKSGKVLGYDEVELKVKEALRQDLVLEYLGALKKQAKINVEDKALSAVQ